jgi:hypothetical protein
MNDDAWKDRAENSKGVGVILMSKGSGTSGGL